MNTGSKQPQQPQQPLLNSLRKSRKRKRPRHDGVGKVSDRGCEVATLCSE